MQFRAFSLFSLQPNLDVEMPKGVFCLAGANGLGKSTFLAAINFGLTGFVPDPRKPYRSSEEYYELHRNKTNYSDAFFSGRIAEEDRQNAAITLHLELGGEHARITRGIFTPYGLREFSRSDPRASLTLTADDDDQGAKTERDYQKWLTTKAGLHRFAQYAFLQHVVLTFDESRHLLLWDRQALNEALFLAIGTDPQRAARATELRRQKDRAESRARNIQFQVNNVTQRIDVIRALAGDPNTMDEADLKEIEAQYADLEELVGTQEEKLEQKRTELRDAELQRARASAQLTSLEDQYNRLFDLHMHRRSQIDFHPLIAATLSEDECAVCGTEEVASAVQQCVGKRVCPLCRTDLSKSSSTVDFTELIGLDREIAKVKAALHSAVSGRARLSREAQAAEARLAAVRADLAQFETVNRTALHVAETKGLDVRAVLARHREERRDLSRQKASRYAIRDERLEQLVVLQDELKREYALAESDFVPVLQNLAREFLGVDLIVRAVVSEAITTVGFTLELEMRGSPRRKEHQLSESQRFFLDIALRMALAQYMFPEEHQAALAIDTPEGSLDIAYEARAGQMFATFTEGKRNLVMTANINTSQLLRRLAELCGAQGMTLHRMTSWTELSDVQLAEESLFETAYEAIEEALRS